MRSLFTAALLLLAPAAHAQIFSVYGTLTVPRISGVVDGSDGSVTTGYSATTSSIWTPGVGAGLTFGVLPIGPVRIGLDIRGSAKTGNNSSDTVLVGPRIAIKLPVLRLKPYIQASGGYLRTTTTIVNGPLPAGTQERQTFAAYEIIGGIDYPLLRILDLRVIEIGGGQGYIAFGSSTAPNVSLFTISSGVVLHF
jgi:hypothetical protein